MMTPQQRQERDFMHKRIMEQRRLLREMNDATHDWFTASSNLVGRCIAAEKQAADWKRVAGELAKCLKEGQERIICSEHYPFDEAAKALAAFEAMEKATK